MHSKTQQLVDWCLERTAGLDPAALAQRLDVLERLAPDGWLPDRDSFVPDLLCLCAALGRLDGPTAEGIRRNLSKALPELQRATTPEAWVKESYAASVETVYQQGRLKWRLYDEWSKRAETGVKAEDFPAIDPEYAISARELARRRAALAGVRLSDFLNEILR